MKTQLIERLESVEGKIMTDFHGRINKKVIAKTLEGMVMANPELASVMNQIKAIHVIRKKETYDSLMDSILEKEGWGRLSIENFYQVYSFEKPEGYSVRGMAFDNQKIIVINLNQLFQCADEYAQYLMGDEGERRRDYRYFAKDSHYDNFIEMFSNKHQAVNFLFWHTLLEQIRSLQQSTQVVDMSKYEYDDESTAEANDMIGFSKYMYEHFVGKEKAID